MKCTTGIAAVCWLLVILMTGQASGATWSYDGANGPRFWHQIFPQACSGKFQSPIDIRPAQTQYDPSLNRFAIWYDPPRPGSTLVISNSGHTVQVVTNGEFYVANGGLPYVYRTTQFHFHWGHARHHGSEHLIDNKAFPLELHIVGYNSDLYSGMSEAVTEKQGLAILAVLFQMSDKDNKDLEPIIRALREIRDPEAAKKVEIEAMSLRKLLPKDSTRYYRYNGSVTTPGCFESVVWTVFAVPRPISHRQMHKFRQLLQPRRRHYVSNAHNRSRRSYPVTSHLYDVKALTRRQRRRERRAVEVLDELALSRDQTDRFRRELVQVKEKADAVTPRIDEDKASKAYHRMLEAVYQTSRHQGAGGAQDGDPLKLNVSEVEAEYIQEKLVNNFRSVQPLNDRRVFRSFQEVPEASPGGLHRQGAQHGMEAALGRLGDASLQDGTSTAAVMRGEVFLLGGRGLVSSVLLAVLVGCLASVLL